MWLLSATTLSAILLVIPHLYLGWRFKKYIGFITSKSKRWLIPIAIIVSFYVLPIIGVVKFILEIDVDFYRIPSIVIYWYWFGFVLTFGLFTWLIIIDVVAFISRKLIKRPVEEINTFYGYVVIGVSTIVFVFTAIKMIVDTNQIDTKYTTVSGEQIPSAFSDFRIVHISDLQADKFTDAEDIAEYVSMVNELNPDLVVFTGDLVSYGTEYIEPAARELSKIKATYGLYTVIGDHDYWAGVKSIKAAYKKYDINLMQDENIFIKVDGDSLLLTGITEVYDKKIPADSLEKLVTSQKNNQFQILITHQASEKVIEAAQKQRYEMILSGHTHGGQLRVPIFFTHKSAPSFETDYLSGVYTIDQMMLNVNNGLGFTLAPVRYAAQPSISVIDVIP